MVRSVPGQAQRLALVSAMVVATLIAGSGVAFADPAAPPPSAPAAPAAPAPPPPTPPAPTPPSSGQPGQPSSGAPVNPSDQQLGQSKQDIAAKAVEVGRLSSQLTQVQDEADRLGMKLSARQEDANQALADQQDAQVAADAAERDACGPCSETLPDGPSRRPRDAQFTCRPPACAQYGSRSLNFWILPVAVRGISVRNSTEVGAL